MHVDRPIVAPGQNKLNIANVKKSPGLVPFGKSTSGDNYNFCLDESQVPKVNQTNCMKAKILATSPYQTPLNHAWIVAMSPCEFQ